MTDDEAKALLLSYRDVASRITALPVEQKLRVAMAALDDPGCPKDDALFWEGAIKAIHGIRSGMSAGEVIDRHHQYLFDSYGRRTDDARKDPDKAGEDDPT